MTSFVTIQGLSGYFHLPYGYLANKQLFSAASGIWTIGDILYRTSSLPTMRILNIPKDKQDQGDQSNRNRLMHGQRNK
jgi:hypothetical protein